MNGLFWERAMPMSIAIATAIATYTIFSIDWDISAIIKLQESVLSAGITVGAVFAGFDAVERGALLDGVHKRFEKILESPYGNLLLSYIDSSLKSALAFIAVSFMLLLVDEAMRLVYLKYALMLWLFSLVHMLLAFYRCHTILSMMHKYAQQRK